ncbi:unannotated protein [freshwater metagenome]|uniref:Unannotated protein n=1 Tax=freshwater metagenome TaxID=449393 RepID=A0A6J7RYM6_9ZZZZ
MAWLVSHHHDLAPHVHPLVQSGGFQQRDPAGFGAEAIGVAIDELHVGMFGDRPKPRSVGFGSPVNGVLGSKHSEHLVVLFTRKAVQVQQVYVFEFHIGGSTSAARYVLVAKE